MDARGLRPVSEAEDLPDEGKPTRGAHSSGATPKFFDRLVEQGVVILGGPIASTGEDEVALLAVEAADEHELRSIFGGDPWAANGIQMSGHPDAPRAPGAVQPAAPVYGQGPTVSRESRSQA